MKNGYFKLQFTDHESYVSLFPPVDGGDPIQVDELRDYLVSKGFPNVDVVALKQVVDALSKQENIKIDKKKIDMPGPIKQAGNSTVTVKLFQDVSAKLKVKVTV